MERTLLTSNPNVSPPIGFSTWPKYSFSMNDESTSCTCGKFVINFMRIFMWPENVMSSSRTGIAALAKPFPRRTLKMIFGLTLVSFCFSVISA